MDLLTVSTDDLRQLPLIGVAAVCLRAAMRVSPLMNSGCDGSLTVATEVLRGREPCHELNLIVEDLYQVAARHAAQYRSTHSKNAAMLAAAGAIIHSAVDCIADLEHDPEAALTNGMLALRSCGKLDSQSLAREVTRDLSCLKNSLGRVSRTSDALRAFGPLWSDEPPVCDGHQ